MSSKPDMTSKPEETGGPQTEPKTAPKTAPKTKKPSAKTKTAATKSKTPSTKSKAMGAKSKAPSVKSKAASVKSKSAGAKKKAPVVKARKSKGKEPVEPRASFQIGDPVLDPIGDVSDGEGRFGLGDPLEPEAEETASSAMATEADDGEDEPEADRAERPPAKLERLQKILSQAGIASRRRAEEMIVAGLVMVNGQMVTQLGAKADAARDHIRVDGKLLHGAERHRYFILNKPKGYVTTVSDPEGRPTVMEFFAKMGERLYPVGRLDYQSEGLLLVTNDGELANRLTRASLGVEKTYLVKVAGQPTEDELEILRGGVSIERDKPGSPTVRTAPARIRQIRQGDNPWYEVVLIEGRNRELRKMFSALGHFVEKIRRVGYGPLVLDVEPGKLRELTPEELAALRLAAEGKLKSRRLKAVKMLPREAGRPAEERGARPAASAEKPFRKMGGERETRVRGPQEQRYSGSREGRTFAPGARPGLSKPGGERFGAKPKFGAKPGFGAKPRFDKPEGERSGERAGSFRATPGPQRPFRGKPDSGHAPRPRFDRPAPQGKPRFDRPAFPVRPRRPDAEPRADAKPRVDAEPRVGAQPPRAPFRPRGERPAFQRPEQTQKRFGKAPGKSFGKRPDKSWSKGQDSHAGKTEGSAPAFRGPARPGSFSKPGFKAKPSTAKPGTARTGSERPGGFSKPGYKGSGYKGKPSGAKRTGQRPPQRPGQRPWSKGPGGKKRG